MKCLALQSVVKNEKELKIASNNKLKIFKDGCEKYFMNYLEITFVSLNFAIYIIVIVCIIEFFHIYYSTRALKISCLATEPLKKSFPLFKPPEHNFKKTSAI